MTCFVAVARAHARDALRGRWAIGVAGLLAASMLAVTIVGSKGAQELGLRHRGATWASAIGIALLLPSLIGMLLGSATISAARERGDLVMLMAQPVRRSVLVAGIGSGLVVVLWVVILGGSGISLLIAGGGPGVTTSGLVTLAVVSAAVAAAGVSIGLALGSRCRSRAEASVWTTVTWFVLALGIDMLLTAISSGVALGPRVLLAVVVLDPLECARVLALLLGDSGDVALGPFGSYITTSLGAGRTEIVLSLTLAAWIVVPGVGASWILSRRDA